MATHDYVIDNSTGANVRADINSVLQAILTNNSSSSAPSTTAAYMFWADTTSGTLKIRNSSDNAWVELLQLDGTLTLEDGSASTPALAFRDDLNTGIYSSAADTFNVATAGVERMELGATTIFNESGADVDFRIEGDTEVNLFYVDASTNRIGIGTSSPSTKFRVDHSSGGNIACFSDTSSADLFINCTSGVTLLSPSTGTLALGTSQTERIRIDSSGNVMIGATSAPGKFHVANGNIVLSDNYNFQFGQNSDRACISGVSGSSGRLQFDVNNSEKMRIDASGNVMIGTTTAESFFGIKGSSGSADLFSISDIAVPTSGDEYGVAMIKSNAAAYMLSITGYNSNSKGLRIYNNGGSVGRTSFEIAHASGTKMIVDGSGNVGIGTNDPNGESINGSQNLVIMDTSSDGGMNIKTGTSGLAQIHFSDTSANGQGRLVYAHSDDSMRLFSAGSERMRIDTQGRVMIGTTNHSSNTGIGIKLAYDATNPSVNTVINQSAGNHSFYHLYNTNATHNAYRFYVQVNGGVANHSGNNVNLSDERMKKNITNMGSVYDSFKKFTFKDFNYIDDAASDSKKHGLIAQDVETIDSDLITEDFKIAPDSEGNDVYRKALKEEQFMMIGMKALQEAIAKIEVLETKVAALEAA